MSKFALSIREQRILLFFLIALFVGVLMPKINHSLDNRYNLKSAHVNIDSRVVNINTDDLNLLAELPGIGLYKAKAIVAYRKAHGAFVSIEDLREVKGIGPVTVKQLAGYISFK